jgi:hypothetical protein
MAGSSTPSSRFASAAEALTWASARSSSGRSASRADAVPKFAAARTVCVP